MENTYWNYKGTHQDVIEELNALVPTSGSVPSPRKNKALEKFRRASNCYYDLYNNGLWNRAAEFRREFGIPSSHYKYFDGINWRFTKEMHELVERKMDEIVLAAADEQAIHQTEVA